MTVVRIGERQRKRRSSLLLRRVTPGMAILVFLAIVVLRLWVVETAIVEGRSMEDALQPGDRVLILKPLERKRFDIVVVNDPDGRGASIKRIVGMPGDVVSMVPYITETSSGPAVYGSQLYVNGEPYEEAYATSVIPVSMQPTKIADDSYFVLGDNRDASIDSRRYGAVAAEDIRGVGVAVVFPFTRTGIIAPGSQAAVPATAQNSS